MKRTISKNRAIAYGGLKSGIEVALEVAAGELPGPESAPWQL
jgi:hypothetical protein